MWFVTNFGSTEICVLKAGETLAISWLYFRSLRIFLTQNHLLRPSHWHSTLLHAVANLSSEALLGVGLCPACKRANPSVSVSRMLAEGTVSWVTDKKQQSEHHKHQVCTDSPHPPSSTGDTEGKWNTSLSNGLG